MEKVTSEYENIATSGTGWIKNLQERKTHRSVSRAAALQHSGCTGGWVQVTASDSGHPMGALCSSCAE